MLVVGCMLLGAIGGWVAGMWHGAAADTSAPYPLKMVVEAPAGALNGCFLGGVVGVVLGG